MEKSIESMPTNIRRMGSDEWYFCVHLITGDTFPCSHIEFTVYFGIVWADIECFDYNEISSPECYDVNFQLGNLKFATERKFITVQADKIVAIYEATYT